MAKDSNYTKRELDAKFSDLSGNIDEIKNNHLVHLSADVAEVKKSVDELKITMAKWTGGLAVILLVIEIISKLYK